VTSGQYEKYIVREPLHEDPPNELRSETPNTGVTRSATFMSGVQAPGAPMHIMWSIIHDVPRTNPYIAAHDHPYDEILFFQGFDPADTLDLGAVFELMLEDEPHVIDSTCAIYIPAGMRHNPLTVISVDRPCGLAAISADGLYRTEGYITAEQVET
jgi:hypothetical protein